MSAVVDVGTQLTALVHKSRSRREHTVLAGLHVTTPWGGSTWDGVRFYNAQHDPRVVNKAALPVRYMTGADVPPHVTIGVVNADQKAALEEFKSDTAHLVDGLAFVCKGPVLFPASGASLLLGAQGYGGVVMELEVPADVCKLRVALQACVPHPVNVFGDIGTEPAPWNPHVTVGYVADEASGQQLLSLLDAYIGQKVQVHGWF